MPEGQRDDVHSMVINEMKDQCEKKNEKRRKHKVRCKGAEESHEETNTRKERADRRGHQEKGDVKVKVNRTHNRYSSLASTALTGFPSNRSSEASCARHIRNGGRIHYSESKRGDMNINICDAMSSQ